MLWNWYTVDVCKSIPIGKPLRPGLGGQIPEPGFLCSQWRITSSGMMAGCCIGVVLLVMSLEFLRRESKEYDAFIIRQHLLTASPLSAVGSSGSNFETKGTVMQSAMFPAPKRSFKPSLLQQLVRSTLHMLQFAVAYFVMLY